MKAGIYKEFFDAINDRNIQLVRTLLSADSGLLNIQDENEDTPLHLAVLNENSEMILFLLQQGALLNIKNLLGDLPVVLDSNGIIKEFLINHLHFARDNIFHDAASKGDIEKMQSLLDEEPGRLNAPNEMGSTPLHWAVVYGSSEGVKFLLEKGALANIEDFHGCTAYSYVRSPSIRQLLEKHGGINPDTLDTDLHKAAAKGDVKLMDILLRDDPSLLNMQNNGGLTALHLAVLENKLDAVLFLLQQYSQENIRGNLERIAYTTDNFGLTAYEYTLELPEIRRSMANICADATGDPIFTMLHMAADRGDMQPILQIMTGLPELIDAVDSQGRTPLFYAVLSDRLEAVKCLLGFKADTTAVDYTQLNIISWIKTLGPHNESSRFLKEAISFKRAALIDFQNECQTFINRQLKESNKEGKKLLICIGESHGNYKINQIEKAIIRAALERGIFTLYEETPHDIPGTKIGNFAKTKLNMEVRGVDKHPRRFDAAWAVSDEGMLERNKIILSEISHSDKNAIFICGADHMQGLDHIFANTNQFHVVYFNLCPLAEKIEEMPSLPERRFAFLDPNVIQISDCQMPSQQMSLFQIDFKLTQEDRRPLPIATQALAASPKPNIRKRALHNPEVQESSIHSPEEKKFTPPQKK